MPNVTKEKITNTANVTITYAKISGAVNRIDAIDRTSVVIEDLDVITTLLKNRNALSVYRDVVTLKSKQSMRYQDLERKANDLRKKKAPKIEFVKLEEEYKRDIEVESKRHVEFHELLSKEVTVAIENIKRESIQLGSMQDIAFMAAIDFMLVE